MSRSTPSEPPARARTASRALVAALLSLGAVALSCSSEPDGVATPPTPRTTASPAPSQPTAEPATAAASVKVHPFGGGLTRLIEQRKGSVSAAVYVGATDRTYKFGEPLHVYTASIIKVAVLASLLQEGSLSPKERRLAQRMIELSDNDATTALWRKQGGAPALFTFFAAAGMRDTHSAPVVFLPWDGVQTTALDQVTMLRHVFDGSLLSPAAIRYELRLMQSVAPNDAWGVSAGATRGQTVALKNGWLPVDKEGWTINSVGVITNRDGSAYAMAVLSSGSPSMEYGIQTVELVASHVNAALAHAAQQRIR